MQRTGADMVALRAGLPPTSPRICLTATAQTDATIHVKVVGDPLTWALHPDPVPQVTDNYRTCRVNHRDA